METLVSKALMIRLSLQPAPAFRDIGLQQYSRLQQPLRRAFAFPYQRFKPFAFLAAQPNNILLYRNLLGSHDCLRRPRCDGIESQNPVREWIGPALASPDLVLGAQPPTQPHRGIAVDRPVRFVDGAYLEVVRPSAQRAIQRAY